MRAAERVTAEAPAQAGPRLPRERRLGRGLARSPAGWAGLFPSGTVRPCRAPTLTLVGLKIPWGKSLWGMRSFHSCFPTGHMRASKNHNQKAGGGGERTQSSGRPIGPQSAPCGRPWDDAGWGAGGGGPCLLSHDIPHDTGFQAPLASPAGTRTAAVCNPGPGVGTEEDGRPPGQGCSASPASPPRPAWPQVTAGVPP